MVKLDWEERPMAALTGTGLNASYTYDTYGNLAGINYYPNGTNAQTYHVVMNSRGDVE